MVRWNLRCFPRILDNVMGTMVNLDGLSEYHFNDVGFVQMHKVCPNSLSLSLPVITVAMTEPSQQPPDALRSEVAVKPAIAQLKVFEQCTGQVQKYLVLFRLMSSIGRMLWIRNLPGSSTEASQQQAAETHFHSSV